MKENIYNFHIFILLCFFIPLSSNAQFFKDVAEEANIEHVFDVGDYHFGGGAAVIDYNNDGWEDVFIAGGVNNDALYHNNGDGTFTNVANESGIFNVTKNALTMGAVAGDFDNDGYKELYITTRGTTNDYNDYIPNYLLKNNGDGTFSDISLSSGIAQDTAFSTCATLGDVNLDGLLDIYVGNFFSVPVSEVMDEYGFAITSFRPGDYNYLYINNGNLTFEEVGEAMGCNDQGTAWSVVFTDYDNDADMDIYIANDFGFFLPNALYRNEYPENYFTDVIFESAI